MKVIKISEEIKFHVAHRCTPSFEITTVKFVTLTGKQTKGQMHIAGKSIYSI